MPWFCTTFGVESTKVKAKKGQLTVKNVNAAVKILRVYHKPQSGAVSEKYCVEISSNKFIATSIISGRKSAKNFKKCSIDWVLPYSKDTQFRLSQLKKNKIIGSWFLTAQAANLMVLPTEEDDALLRTGGNEKNGVLIKNPDLDVYVNFQDFKDFESFKAKGVYINKKGEITSSISV